MIKEKKKQEERWGLSNSFTLKYNPLAFQCSHGFCNFTDFLIQFLVKNIGSDHGNTNSNEHRNREGEKGAGAVQSEGGSLAFLLACFSRCARVDAFYGRKRTWDAL